VAENTPTSLRHLVIQGIMELGPICASPWVHGHPEKSWWANGKSWVLNISFMSLLHEMQGSALILGYTATVTFLKSPLISNTSSSSYIEKSIKRLGPTNTPLLKVHETSDGKASCVGRRK